MDAGSVVNSLADIKRYFTTWFKVRVYVEHRRNQIAQSSTFNNVMSASKQTAKCGVPALPYATGHSQKISMCDWLLYAAAAAYV